MEQSPSRRNLAAKVDVLFTYASEFEDKKLDFGDCPSHESIRK